LLANQFGLRFLRFGEFLVLGFHDGLKFCELLGLALDFVRDKSASLIRLFDGDRLPFTANAFLDLSVDLLPGRD
jgi:hypothetical protein